MAFDRLRSILQTGKKDITDQFYALNQKRIDAGKAINNQVNPVSGNGVVGTAIDRTSAFLNDPKKKVALPNVGYRGSFRENPVGNTARGAWNLAADTANSIVGRGILDPWMDMGKVASEGWDLAHGRDISLDPMRYKSGPARLGAMAVSGAKANQVIGAAADTALPIANAYLPKAPLKAISKPTFVSKFVTGTKAGVGAGAMFGGVQALSDNQDKTLPQQLTSGAIGAGTGAVLGGALGAAVPVAGEALRLANKGAQALGHEYATKGAVRRPGFVALDGGAPVQSKTAQNALQGPVKPKTVPERISAYNSRLNNKESLPAKPSDLTSSEQKFIETTYSKARADYLKKNATAGADGQLAHITLNTDDFRPYTVPLGYKGTNAHVTHEVASEMNKRLYNEALTTMRGKGNNTIMTLAGGGGSGKGTAIQGLVNKAEYPIVLDQVSGDYGKLLKKFTDAKANGYDFHHVFVDRPPELAWQGVTGRAQNLLGKGELPRTVPIDRAVADNLAARETTIKAIKAGKFPVVVIDNSGGRGEARLITDPKEQIDFLTRNSYNQDELIKRLTNETNAKLQSGELHSSLAEGFYSGNGAAVSGKPQLQYTQTGAGARGTVNAPGTDALPATQAKAGPVKPLPERIEELNSRLNGNDTFTATGTKGETKLASESRSIQEDASGFVNKALSSNNVVVRKVAGLIKGFSGSSGRSYEQVDRIGKLRGGMAEATQLMDDIKRESDLLLPDETSRARVFSVMDPETAKGTAYEGLSETNLSPQEQKALAFYREVSDLINESSYSQGRISDELYQKGKGGNYLPRTYELYELPPEIQKSARTKADLSAYKQRKEFDEWKTENLIRDPGYALAKRFQQVHANKAIFEYGQWLAKQTDKVSDVPRPDFVKLGDDKAWGALAGKYVRQDALDDIRGFHGATEAAQAVYDVLNAFDSNKVRQFLKKTKTVYNPATRLGNQIGNRTFAFISGLNPITFEKNVQTYAKKALRENDALVRYLRRNGVVGTDASRADLARSLQGERTTGLKKAAGFIEDTYGNADDHAKIAAFKTWIDKGYSQEEALRRVRQGFQDYSTVGRFYDFGAKTPIMGNAFVRFQADLGRILKNAALENPLRLAALAGGIMIMGDTLSKMSGETPEDRNVRTSRLGTPKLPFTDIPLAFQTPYGEINAARIFGLYSLTPGGGENTASNSLSRMSPIQIPTNKEDVLKSLGSDVMVGPVVSLATDTDFRGKSIADPDQTKYKKSTLTPAEQNMNRLKYVARSYNFPVANDTINIGLASQGKPDQYGKIRTIPQAIARAAGVKVETFGPKEAEAQRERNEQFAQYEKEDVQKQIRAVEKELSNGNIDQATADKRITNLQNKLKKDSSGIAKAAAADSRFGDAIRQSKADNKYYFYDSKGERVSDENKDKLDLKYAKELVKTGKEQKVKVGDKYIVADDSEDGYRTVDIKEVKRDAEDKRLTYGMENAKEDDDIDQYLSLAKESIQRKTDYLKTLDPELDADEILTVQEEITDLNQKVSKYSGYGGFKKPSTKKEAKGPKFSSYTLDPSLNADTYKKLQSLLSGANQTPQIAPVAKKVTLKKRKAV